LPDYVNFLANVSMSATPAPDLAGRVTAVRRFNRLYTRRIGLLRDNVLLNPYSLTQARVLYELAQRDKPTASELVAELGLDHGYLSRILRDFGERGLVTKAASPNDRRQSLLALTARGWAAYARLDRRSQDGIAAMMGALSVPEQERAVAAMGALERIFGERLKGVEPYILRPPRPGDMGWIVNRHGLVYGREYGWDERLEALTAEIVAAFLRSAERTRECCWIAERDGENVGSVLLVKETDDVARLRLLLVEPQARGLGIGARLVDECIRFARDARYRKITLWTHSVLTAARRIYEQAGFTLVGTKEHNEFGKRLVGETWDLSLSE
jgi:DNA-binding MarR family transcriptional regulator/N-acetylglutamate synthase-like GNAT family acetyltransferase